MKKFRVRIYSANNKIFDDDAVILTAFSKIGSFTIMHNHAPYMAVLNEDSKVTIKKNASDEDCVVIILQSEAVMNFRDNMCSIVY